MTCFSPVQYAASAHLGEVWWCYVHPSYGGSKHIVIHGSNLRERRRRRRRIQLGRSIWIKPKGHFKTKSLIRSVCQFWSLVPVGQNRTGQGWFLQDWGDGVAHLVQRRIQDPKTRGSNPVMSTRKVCESFSQSLMLCWLAVGVSAQPLCIYAQHKNDYVLTLKIL